MKLLIRLLHALPKIMQNAKAISHLLMVVPLVLYIVFIMCIFGKKKKFAICRICSLMKITDNMVSLVN